MREPRCELPGETSAKLATPLDVGPSLAGHRLLIRAMSRRLVDPGITAAGL
jgi:hypothetical protein